MDEEDYIKEIEDLTILINEDNKNPQLYMKRGVKYKLIGNLDKSIEDFNIAIELEPNNADFYYQRGCIYIIVMILLKKISLTKIIKK